VAVLGQAMSTMAPLFTGWPVTGSCQLQPAGSTIRAPKSPWPQEWIASTWSCQKTVPVSASGYQR